MFTINKKFLFLLSCVLLIGMASMMAYRERHQFLGLPTIDGSEADQIVKNRSKQSRDIDLMFNSQPVPYAYVDHQYYLPVDIQKKDWEKGLFTSGDPAIQLCFVVREDWESNKLDAVKAAKPYQLLAYDSDSYCIYPLVFTGLPFMSLEVDRDTRELERYTDKEDMAAAMSLYNPYNAEVGRSSVQSSAAYLHARGATSRNFPKLGYKLELVDENDDKLNMNLLGLREDDDWILKSMYSEESKIRDLLSSRVWEMIGLDHQDYKGYYGYQGAYLELIINGEYWGLYSLLTRVDAKALNVDSQNTLLFKSLAMSIPGTQSFLDAVGQSYVLANNESLSFTIKYPGSGAPDLWEEVQEFANLVMKAPDPEFKQQALTYLDLENAIDYWLFVQAIAGGDNRWNNAYYVREDYRNSRKTLVVPWDNDLTWGLGWNQDVDHLNTHIDFTTQILQVPVGSRLLDNHVGNSVSYLKSRWEELRKGPLTQENLYRIVDELASQVYDTGAMKRDKVRWPNGAYAQDCSYIKTFIQKRLPYLDSYIGGFQ